MPLITGDNNNGGIITPSPTGFAPQGVPQVNIVSPQYQDVAVDTKYTPIDTLMTMVEGSYWTVDYYSQIIDTDTPLTPQAVTVSAPYQQYNRIEALQMKVQTPLKSQQDDQTKMMDLDGASIVFAGLIPNEGDAFVADIGVGAYAVFRVTSTEKLSIFKQAAYKIEYALASTDQSYLDDLANKTQSSYVYRADFLAHGQNPIIETTESASIDSLQIVINRLTDQYFSMFFDPEFSTIMLPQQTVSVYDPFLTSFLLKCFTPSDSPYINRITQPNVQDNLAMKQDNIWTALLNRDASYLKTGFTQVGLVYAAQFSDNPYNNGVKWTGIDCVIYPQNPRIGLFGLQAYQVLELLSQPLTSPSTYTYIGEQPPTDVPPPLPTDPAQLTDTPVNGTASMFPPTNVGNAAVTVPSAINSDGSYVLSANFYNNTIANLSVLEQAVWTYLNGQALDPVQLSNTANLYPSWGIVEQFYYLPILIMLMKAYILDYQG